MTLSVTSVTAIVLFRIQARRAERVSRTSAVDWEEEMQILAGRIALIATALAYATFPVSAETDEVFLVCDGTTWYSPQSSGIPGKYRSKLTLKTGCFFGHLMGR